jgi:hypothetical protein
MRQPPTGEPCAGKPPARFGGRGGREPFPTPMLTGQACTCADFERGQAPEGWCAHRIAAGIQKRVQELLPPAAADKMPPLQPVAPLPEAPASMNVHLTISGRQVQLTLRDSDEGRLLGRLEAVLQRFPLPAPEASGERTEQGKGWCRKHNVQMKLTQKEGRSWRWDHQEGQWCKGR